MNGFSPHLPWLYRQFLHFQRLKGVIWRNYSGIKISHQAKEDFMFLRCLFLQFPVCRWDRGWQRELKMSRWYLLLSAGSTPPSSAVSSLSKETDCSHVFLLLLLKILEKSIKEGLHSPLKDFFFFFIRHFFISWGIGLDVAFRNLALEIWLSFAHDFREKVLIIYYKRWRDQVNCDQG